ncbi:MAG: VWA domain-containing protein [Candidatus Binatia bacterium]|nr:VWA domain-containing protein [Candidatus Binatia bacterium]
MRDVTLRFIDALRTAGLRISVGESIDAVRAVAAVGIEREPLREALAASLVKDEADRPLFEATFARFFATPGARRKGTPRGHLSAGVEQRPHPDGLAHLLDRPPAQRREDTQPSRQRQPHQGRDLQLEQEQPGGAQEEDADGEREGGGTDLTPSSRSLAALLTRRALLDKPFKAFGPRDVEAAKELVEELARRLHVVLSRRYKRRKRGRLDFRRTIRASLAYGGVPVDVQWRGRRPGKRDLIALCDLSGSVALVADFLLALLAPARAYFRRVRTFAYVDRFCEISFEHGYVVPHGELDLYAASDFGRVLQQFWQEQAALLTRNTLVLILGDARNNRRPPRADLLVRLRHQVREVVWLNPEPHERWNTGDSVIRLYTPACDRVLACSNLRELLGALRRCV